METQGNKDRDVSQRSTGKVSGRSLSSSSSTTTTSTTTTTPPPHRDRVFSPLHPTTLVKQSGVVVVFLFFLKVLYKFE